MYAEFCEAGEILMEYVGEVIRRPIADVRERAMGPAERADTGCYMFALDADHIVDSSKAGNIARFINHSCRLIQSPCEPHQQIRLVLLFESRAGGLVGLVCLTCGVCCSPNCIAANLEVKGRKGIYLRANRQLAPGEELTYVLGCFDGSSNNSML